MRVKRTNRDILERNMKAVELRASGMTYEEIAARMGWKNRGQAHQAVHKTLAKYEHLAVEEARTLSAMRLDSMLEAIWPKCLEGDIPAIRTALDIESQRAKLLGLNAPTQIDITHTIRRIAEEHGMDPDQALTEAAEILRDMGL
jgi:hypothetical protein